jgi:hypothetical protein
VGRSRAPSPQTIAVLAALAADPGAWRHGYGVGLETGLRAGSLYPILIRLADRGLLEARWESSPPPGRPARHLYRLTPAGRELARVHTPAVGGARGRAVRSAAPRLGLDHS